MTIHIGRNHLILIGLGVLGVAALAFLAGVPLTNVLWFGLVLACPLMMLFMHGGHSKGPEPKVSPKLPEAERYPPRV